MYSNTQEMSTVASLLCRELLSNHIALFKSRPRVEPSEQKGALYQKRGSGGSYSREYGQWCRSSG